MIETELAVVGRAFPEAQRLLADVAEVPYAAGRAVGWHDVGVSPHVGASAVVRAGGPLEELVGEVLRLRRNGRSVVVYVVGAADVPTDLSIARRAMLAMGGLWEETVEMSIAIVGPEA